MPAQIKDRKPPAYRHRPGYRQALVTLTDAVTKRRRDYWLGEFDTPESREMYYRVIAAWEASGRRLPDRGAYVVENHGPRGLTVTEIIAEYWRWAESYYSPGQIRALKPTLKLVRRLFGTAPAREFGPKKLRFVREEMIRGDCFIQPPRRAWSRKAINMAVQRIRHVFRWAVAREMVPPPVHQALSTLEPLRRGRSAAREAEKVGPVAEDILRRTLPHLSNPVRALVDLQLLTGARPGELLGLRCCDLEIDKKAGIWTYRPEEHKSRYREKERVIYFGPRAQEVLRPFLLDRATTAILFRPVDAELDRRAAAHERRKTPLSCGNRPGINRVDAPVRKPGERYTTSSYNRAVRYACERAFPPPEPLCRAAGETKKEWLARLAAEQKTELRAWQKEHRFHVHQLRHNAATNLRREFGLEAAQLALGHASAQITDAVYAERDRAKVIEIMRRIG